MRKVLTCIILIVLGTGFCIWGWRIIVNARASGTWPHVVGTIMHASVRTTDSQSNGKTTRMYSADIRYRYQVSGKTYVSGQVSLSDHSSSSSSGMKKLIWRYPAGKSVSVYYNPTDPKDALLEPGTVFISYIPFAFGIISILAGLFALFRKKSVSMPPPGSRRSGLTHGGKYSGGTD
jgi:hypothetical protein